MNVNGTKNAVKGKRGFQKKETMYETARENTEVIEQIKDKAVECGLPRDTNPIDFMEYVWLQLQMIKPQDQKEILDRAVVMCKTHECSTEKDTGDWDMPAVATKLVNDQLNRQNDLLKKNIPGKAAIKVDVNAGRKVVIVRPD